MWRTKLKINQWFCMKHEFLLHYKQNLLVFVGQLKFFVYLINQVLTILFKLLHILFELVKLEHI